MVCNATSWGMRSEVSGKASRKLQSPGNVIYCFRVGRAAHCDLARLLVESGLGVVVGTSSSWVSTASGKRSSNTRATFWCYCCLRLISSEL